MHLEDILKDIYEYDLPESFRSIEVPSISCDSRKVDKNGLFVALKGGKFDGAQFIDDVIEKGARIVVTDELTQSQIYNPNVCHLKVADPNKFLREVVQRFFNNSSSKIHTIGITGTNGKTTTSYMIESVLKEAEFLCGVVGTVNRRIGDKVFPSTHTTPDFLENQKNFAEMVNEGVDYCVMEVSSHALVQRRVDLINFTTAIFTNLTSDHLDYHKTRDNYFLAKSKLFTDFSSLSTAIINADDMYGRKLVAMTQANVMTYGIQNNATVMAKDIQLSISGTQFKLSFPEGNILIRSELIGMHNIYNILAAVSACLAEGINPDRIKKGIENLKSVPGRLERVDCGQEYSIFIDYAHTQDALENVLRTIRQTTDSKIILVFGCGGDRDKTKRPLMGAVANQLADFSIVTSDNPRSEDPQTIIDEIVAGFENSEKYIPILDRKEAIIKALDMAQKNDVVLIAGKGHETYQIFKDRTIKFDERQVITEHLIC